MSICLEPIPNTYGVCGLKRGHSGPHLTVERKGAIEKRRSSMISAITITTTIPSTDQEAEQKIDSLSVDQTITLPAIEIYRCRRGQGDSVVVAYEKAMRAVLRERG